MNAKTTLSRPHAATTIAAAALAVLIGAGILAAVTGLFQRAGTPFQQLVVAERTCADFSFESERKACVELLIAGAQGRSVASR
jgi:hypothetical protein